MASRREIESIFSGYPEDIKRSWITDECKVFYRNGEPFGVVSVFKKHDVSVIASSTSDPSVMFTRGMIREIINLHKSGKICLVSCHEQSWDRLEMELSRYNLRFIRNGKVMYMLNYK
jgi:hypothetical protein